MTKNEGIICLGNPRFELTLERMCRELMEEFNDFEDTCIIALQKGGVPLGKRIHKRIIELTGKREIPFGKLDVTFYRDDFRRSDSPLEASSTDINFLVENKRVILVDDVLYTGRTTIAAFTAIQHFGRPKDLHLLVLVDRRFNRHLPVKPNFTGITIDSIDEAYVKAEWQELHGTDQVILLGSKPVEA